MNTWDEAMQAIGALEERVSEIERNEAAAVMRRDFGPLVSVSDLARLRAIEDAALDLTKYPTPIGDAERVRAWVVLEDALKR